MFSTAPQKGAVARQRSLGERARPKVQLRHFPLTGHSSRKSVTVDGIAVEAVEGGTPRGKAAGTLQVRVGNHDCCVGYRAAPRPGRYYYSCVIDGIVVPELNETVGDGGDGDSEAIPLPGDVVVDIASTARDSFGSAFLEFRVVTRRPSGGASTPSKPLLEHRENGNGTGIGDSGRDAARAGFGAAVGEGVGGGGGRGGGGGSYERRGRGVTHAVVWRRFSAFRALHSDVSSMLRGSHLLDSLPPLPGEPREVHQPIGEPDGAGVRAEAEAGAAGLYQAFARSTEGQSVRESYGISRAAPHNGYPPALGGVVTVGTPATRFGGGAPTSRRGVPVVRH
eukprot:jgi/Undpi1/3699/HiC_scaffold_16.g07069.m1